MPVWKKCGHKVSGTEQECLHCRIKELEAKLNTDSQNFQLECQKEEIKLLQAKLDAYERLWNDLLAVSRQATKLNGEMYPQFREKK